jgi:hypothetical protein
MLRNRFMAALGFALIAGTVIAAPVGAATPIVMCSGTCGNYVLTDSSTNKGAVCKYETASYDLDYISVRPPKMYGHYSNNTGVRWMFKILRSTNFGAGWKVYYASTWQNAMASKTNAAYAGHGFSRRTWNAPDPNPTGWFKVRVFMNWKNSGGSVVGNASAEYDYYKGKWNGFSDDRSDYCIQDW